MELPIVPEENLLKTNKERKKSKKQDIQFLFIKMYEKELAFRIVRDFRDLPSRAASDKVLLDKAFDTAKISKYGRYQH